MQTNELNNIHRMYYVAVVCPPEIDEKVLQYKHWMRERFGCVAALKSPAHLTLIAPFWLEEELEHILKETTHQFQSELLPFEIRLNNFNHFSKSVLFVHTEANEALARLQFETTKHFQQQFPAAVKTGNLPFHPHITIANRDMSPSAFLKAWEHFSKEDYNATFTVSSISLLRLSPGKWNVIWEKTFNSP